jgi:acyl-CoA hydrolase
VAVALDQFLAAADPVRQARAMRVVTMEQLTSVLSGLPPDPRVVVSGNFATPWPLLAALDAAVASYRLFVLNGQPGLPDRDGVILETPFVGAGQRRSPRLRYLPARLSLVPLLFATTCPPDVVVLHTTPVRDEAVSLGIEVNVLPAALEAVRRRGGLVVAQLNPRMPWTYGDAVLPAHEIDLAVQVEAPLARTTPGPLDEVAAAIGTRVAGLVPDGATLQLGIGAVPDAVLHGLAHRRGLRIWSEMFSDGVLELDRARALDPQVPLTASFVFGSDELYRWVDANPRVRVLRTEKTNDPALIARNSAMTSINSALQVDLFGQANASRMHGRIHSGFGGQTDFIVGALHSRGGAAFIALRSWHPKADVSTIIPLVDEPVTSFQASAVVTEQGVAELFGHDQVAQARHLIEHAAHPRVREELWEEAVELGLAGPGTRG